MLYVVVRSRRQSHLTDYINRFRELIRSSSKGSLDMEERTITEDAYTVEVDRLLGVDSCASGGETHWRRSPEVGGYCPIHLSQVHGKDGLDIV